MKSNREQEMVVIWAITIGVMVAALIALLTGHSRWFIAICVGYFAILGSLMLAFRWRFAASQRHRDPCPWDKAMLRNTSISSMTAAIPGLQIGETKGSHRLWLAESQGEYGVWTLMVEDRESEILAYSLTYRDMRSTAFDCGESAVSMNARFFATSG